MSQRGSPILFLDFDGTLFSTGKFEIDVNQIISSIDPDLAAQLTDGVSRYRNDPKHNYSAADYPILETLMSNPVVFERVSGLDREQYIFDDVYDLIDRANRVQVPMMILTFGIEKFQNFKRRGTVIENLPMVAINYPNKTSWIIDNVIAPNGKYHHDGPIILVDDRAGAFATVVDPDIFSGYRIKRPQNSQRSLDAETPDNAIDITSLAEIKF